MLALAAAPQPAASLPHMGRSHSPQVFHATPPPQTGCGPYVALYLAVPFLALTNVCKAEGAQSRWLGWSAPTRCARRKPAAAPLASHLGDAVMDGLQGLQQLEVANQCLISCILTLVPAIVSPDSRSGTLATSGRSHRASTTLHSALKGILIIFV